MKWIHVVILGIVLVVSACGRKKTDASDYPAGFDKIGDAGRIAYVSSKVAPDSLARFIIYSALGRNEGVRIDTLAIATNYAYETLQGDALDAFSVEYDSVVESLPLGDKMKIYMLAGSEDPQRLGYKLGLEYLGTIRDGSKSADEVEKELKAFKSACAGDTATYRRFIIGFRTVLELDHGKDLSEDIYKRFINYE